MIPFELAQPSSLQEAVGLLDPDDPTIRPLGGGTALMLMMKSVRPAAAFWARLRLEFFSAFCFFVRSSPRSASRGPITSCKA